MFQLVLNHFTVYIFPFDVKFKKLLRRSQRRCSVRKSVVRNFTKFTGKHLSKHLFLMNTYGLLLLVITKSNYYCQLFWINNLFLLSKKLFLALKSDKGINDKDDTLRNFFNVLVGDFITGERPERLTCPSMLKDTRFCWPSTLSFIMVKNSLTYFKIARHVGFSKYVWPFFNIMRERVNTFILEVPII